MKKIYILLIMVTISISLIACGKKEEELILKETSSESNESSELDSSNTEVEEKKDIKSGVALVTVDEQAGANKDIGYGKKKILIIDGKALAVLEDSNIRYDYNKNDNTVILDENDWKKVTETSDTLENMVQEIEENTDIELASTKEIEEKNKEIEEKNKELEEINKEIEEKNKEVEEKDKEIEENDKEVKENTDIELASAKDAKEKDKEIEFIKVADTGLPTLNELLENHKK